MSRVTLYARYSSDNQSESSIEDQFRLCREHARREQWRITGTYRDADISGASMILRLGIQALLQDAQRGQFDVVLAEALDRISRDQADVATLFKHLRFAGVSITTLAEGGISELHVGLKGTMNALLLKDFALKTPGGLRGRVEKGKAGGGLCYGYRVAKKQDASGEPIRGDRQIVADEASIIQRIFRAFAAGRSPKAIAIELNREGIPGPLSRAWGTPASAAMSRAAPASSIMSSMPACWSGTASGSSRIRRPDGVSRARTRRSSGSGLKCRISGSSTMNYGKRPGSGRSKSPPSSAPIRQARGKAGPAGCISPTGLPPFFPAFSPVVAAVARSVS
jgi:DNA invertase Pin-like site-specific DNA recombinase